MLVSIGVPLAISFVKKVLGKGMQVRPPNSGRLRPPPPSLPSALWMKKTEVRGHVPLEH